MCIEILLFVWILLPSFLFTSTWVKQQFVELKDEIFLVVQLATWERRSFCLNRVFPLTERVEKGKGEGGRA